MSPHRIHPYFDIDSDPTNWDILQFLEAIPSSELCNTQTFFKQIDSYLKSLEVISEEDNERGVKAHCLLHLYREGNIGSELQEDEDEDDNLVATFKDTYLKMAQDRKWKLSSGEVVEDILYKKYRHSKQEALAHSWILDLGNKDMESLFSKPAWQEIRSHVPALPPADPSMAKLMSEFAVTETTIKLRKLLHQTAALQGETYNREKDYDLEWVCFVVRKMVTLFEGSDLFSDNLEGWYDVNIWSLIVDHCLQNLEGMKTVRKESTCMATAKRKNQKRTKTGKGNHTKIGRRFDGIVRTNGDEDFEYGLMEVAKTSRGGQTATKWIDTIFKVAKALHDMMSHLAEYVNYKEDTVRKLQLVGLINSGLKAQLIRMNCPKGHVCILTRSTPQEVPTSIKGFRALFHLMTTVWQMKQIIKDCEATVNTRHSAETQQEFFKLLMGEEEEDEGGAITTDNVEIPGSINTPPKAKKAGEIPHW
ncbi:hypothetical protein Q9L58_001778 [Maublancomyces gigas]|uniref:Uncharacterized protein n=1 Tax=Discina gigas TaxID=1032678 RepID=A0ABR3GT30_9PEZI